MVPLLPCHETIAVHSGSGKVVLHRVADLQSDVMLRCRKTKKTEAERNLSGPATAAKLANQRRCEC